MKDRQQNPLPEKLQKKETSEPPGFACSIPTCDWTKPIDTPLHVALKEYKKHVNEKHPNIPYSDIEIIRLKQE